MDIGKLLKSLNEHKVKYVIIGAVSFAAHGWSRATRDIDIFIEATQKNAKRTMEAISAIGYDINDLSIDELLTKKILLRQYILETDIHPFVAGVKFDDVWKNKVKEKIYNTTTYFASLNDIITMKKAAGRPKDKEDLKYLLHLKKLKSKK
jgi:predicted nucleotidyltransferase